MPNRETTFMYIGFAAIGLLVLGLAGWYFFISGRTANLNAADDARGFNIGVPSFTGSRGSTAENIAAGFGDSPSEESDEEEEGPQRPPRLWRVNATPVAGSGFVQVGSTTVLRFVERSTGHVFDVDPLTGTITRRTNLLIPKVYEAAIGDGDLVIARSVSNDGARVTFVGTLGTTTIDGFTPLTGTDLGPDIRDIAPTQSGIIFLGEAADGSTRLIRANADGTNPEIIRSFAAGDFNLSHLSDGRTILVEKPASNVAGHAYEAGTSLLSLAGATPGLTLVARASSTAVLVGSDDGSNLALAVRATRDSSLLPLGLKTVAEKCVWMPGLSFTAYCAAPQTPPAPGFLTGWYRGTVHTTDSWYTIDAGGGSSESFLDMSADDAIDVERPTTDGGGNFIAFLNARDKSLWLLRIIE
jgi:hypothetical protein